MTCRARHVALFRAVNVGGTGKIAMADLRDMAERLGLESPRTILQSGNLVFVTEGEAGVIEKRIETECARRFGLATDVMCRESLEWHRLMAANPFEAAARDDPAHLVLLVLKNDATPSAQSDLTNAIEGREQVCVAGRAAYVAFPDGIGRSKLTPQVLERHLGAKATGRNWNTVQKIAEALSS